MSYLKSATRIDSACATDRADRLPLNGRQSVWLIAVDLRNKQVAGNECRSRVLPARYVATR
jgi:hypothetical protein